MASVAAFLPATPSTIPIIIPGESLTPDIVDVEVPAVIDPGTGEAAVLSARAVFDVVADVLMEFELEVEMRGMLVASTTVDVVRVLVVTTICTLVLVTLTRITCVLELGDEDAILPAGFPQSSFSPSSTSRPLHTRASSWGFGAGIVDGEAILGMPCAFILILDMLIRIQVFLYTEWLSAGTQIDQDIFYRLGKSR